MFAWSASNGKKDKLTSAVFQDIMLDGTDPWAKEIAKITRLVHLHRDLRLKRL